MLVPLVLLICFNPYRASSPFRTFLWTNDLELYGGFNPYRASSPFRTLSDRSPLQKEVSCFNPYRASSPFRTSGAMPIAFSILGVSIPTGLLLPFGQSINSSMLAEIECFNPYRASSPFRTKAISCMLVAIACFNPYRASSPFRTAWL